MLGGDLLGAYCLSEAHAGSDPAAMRTRARRDGDEYVLDGTKAWVTHGGDADFYKVMARTSDERNGISCFLVPADTDGLVADPPERKMGLTGSATATVRFEGARVPADRLLGAEGDGLKIALAGLDSGRLGIAAVATGLAQGALDDAVAYAKTRETFGKKIIDHQGLGVPARRHGRRGRVGPGDVPGRGPAQGPGPAVQHRGVDREDGGDRQRHEGHHRRGAGATAATATPATSRSSATCARPRSCRSSKAPTRSSGW